MIDPRLAFFTLDRGTATTAAALVARVDGRFRLLTAAAQPAGLDVEALLDELVAGVVDADPDLLPGARDWRSWTRLEVATHEPPGALLVAASESALDALQASVSTAGWRVAGRLNAEHGDALAAARAALLPDLDLLVLGTADPPRPADRAAGADLAALMASLVERRPGLRVLLSGAMAGEAGRFPGDLVVLGPPAALPATAAGHALRALLRTLAERVALERRGRQAGVGDGRRGFRDAIVSLAAVLERRVEGVDVGCAASQRVLADGRGLRAEMLSAGAGLVPRAALDDDRAADAVLRWSTLRGDPFALRDRVRNLRLHPWRDVAGSGTDLRLAAAHAALLRLQEGWRVPLDDGTGMAAGGLVTPASDLLVASGGVFAVAPPSAVAMTLADTLRRPGGLTLVHDHARLLAPLGSLESEADRRRLLADLLDDALLPLGSLVVATGMRAGRRVGSVRLLDAEGSSEVDLVPGAVQMIELPPGRTAVAEVAARDGAWVGVRSRRLALEVAGGLAGLLVDGRDVPLRLPERIEERREALEAWQRPLWTGEVG